MATRLPAARTCSRPLGRWMAPSRLRPLIEPARRWGSSGPAARTALYDLHIAHGGRMVPFGGYEMPVQYKDLGIIQSHLWTREKASLFDVSHMLQHRFSGPGAQGFLSVVTPSSIAELQVNSSTLSCLLIPQTGGISDDTIVTRLGSDLFYVVTNAGCRDKDIAYFQREIKQWHKNGGADVQWEMQLDDNLIAVQGPVAAEIVNSILSDPAGVDLKSVYFGQCKSAKLNLLDGSRPEVLLFRGGYTGEDGFEISLPANVDPHEVVNTLLKTAGPDKLRLAGLAARDTLRLEAGMCLYGNDLDETTTPAEAALGWIVGAERRKTGGFHGADVIIPQLTLRSKGGAGVTRNRVGLVVDGAPARPGAKITTSDGTEVGTVTSGSPSPSLGCNIAMGYVKNGLHKQNTELAVVVRGRSQKAVVTRMPFVPSKFHRSA